MAASAALRAWPWRAASSSDAAVIAVDVGVGQLALEFGHDLLGLLPGPLGVAHRFLQVLGGPVAGVADLGRRAAVVRGGSARPSCGADGAGSPTPQPGRASG